MTDKQIIDFFENPDNKSKVIAWLRQCGRTNFQNQILERYYQLKGLDFTKEIRETPQSWTPH